jgi:hypothetical protein
VCTTALITQYYNECISSAGPCSFQTGSAEMKACAQCLTSQFTDATWGPLVVTPGLISTNNAGCLAILDPSQMACAQAIEAEMECVYAACDPVCGNTSSDPGFDGWVTCSAAANECGCQSWFAASNCGQALASASSPAAPCFIEQTFEDGYYTMATLFCGP